MLKITGKYSTAKVMTTKLDEACLNQIESLTNNACFKNVVIMPDAHKGMGSVIGFTMPLNEKLIPNVIGVDIGCGMLSTVLKIDSEPDFVSIDKSIRKTVPTGFKIHNKKVVDELNFDIPNNRAEEFFNNYNERFKVLYKPVRYDEKWLNNKIRELDIDKSVFFNSIGSLGGGNHFIEIGKGRENYYLTIHSGSRNFGLKIANYWQRIASSNKPKTNINEEIKQIHSLNIHKKKKKKQIKELKKHKGKQKIKELAFLEGDNMAGYLSDMIFAQFYASINRRIITRRIIKELGFKTGEQIETVHNYIDFKDFIIRKGAIRSYRNEKMIIPFNMRDGLLICEGKSNKEWNYSAPHGAGRIMSRKQAKKNLSTEKFKKSMKGIYSTSVSKRTLDESPFAYKSSKIIEKEIEPTADIIDKVKPVYNLKDS